MTARDVILEIESLSQDERVRVEAWLRERDTAREDAIDLAVLADRKNEPTPGFSHCSFRIGNQAGVKYRIVIRHNAEKEMRRLGHEEQQRVGKKLLVLENQPFPAGAIALQGRQGYRIRIGDYRILYEVSEPLKIVTITAIGHRRDVYR